LQANSGISEEGKDLVIKMTEANPTQRISLSDALSHRCFSFSDTSRFYNFKSHDSILEEEKKKPVFQMIYCM
jgi:hypothetical protein